MSLIRCALFILLADLFRCGQFVMKKFQNIPAKVNAPNPGRPRMPPATVAATV